MLAIIVHHNSFRYTGAYTMEVIASTAFGIDLDPQNTEDELFVKHAKKFFEFSVLDPMFLLVRKYHKYSSALAIYLIRMS